MIDSLNLSEREVIYAIMFRYREKEDEDAYLGEKSSKGSKGVTVKWDKLSEEVQTQIAKFVLYIKGKLPN